MHFFALIFLALQITAASCFLTDSFLHKNSSHSFFDAIKTNDIESSLMEHAVKGELCSRECIENDRKVCHFHFMVKFYETMSGACGNCSVGNVKHCLNRKCATADGVQRGILSINFQLPGPAIHVCKDDIVVVDVQNEAEGLSTSIHFHGMRQIGSQWMDGVPFITQCPIQYSSTFRYAFHARDDGTHFYHSHSGHQKIDGLYGALIVRQPIEKVANRQFYDFDLPEHLILASDWMHQMAENHLPGMIRRSSLSESMLVNGRGRYFNSTNNATTFAPWTIFHVEAGMKYRFRIINSAFNVCPFQFSIERHNFTVIATELSDIEPIAADTLHFLSGERFDVVINANQPIGDYWIRIRELLPCWKNIEGFAILRYHKKIFTNKKSLEFSERRTPAFDDDYPKLNVFNSLKPRVEHIALTAAKSYDSDESLLTAEPDHKFYLIFDSPAVSNKIMFARKNLHNFIFVTSDFSKQMSFVATINNISFQFPSFPLLTEPERIDESMFCDVNHMNRRNCLKGSKELICKCVHRLKVDLNASVEFIAFNTLDRIPHPLHLHGNKFHVLDIGTFNETMDINYEDYKNLKLPKETPIKPPYKDTVLLPFPGYVRFRFRALNPGFWFFHCHYDWHLPIGMALVVQVGGLDQMTKSPNDFPTCHNFMPSGL